VSHSPFHGLVSGLNLDLSRPDALIRTDSLSRLPPDLLKLPVARDVLTEDFVDYYERHENRLSLAGTIVNRGQASKDHVFQHKHESDACIVGSLA
jgi:uncharacterized protein YfaA (DUF2138 family)